jgi:NADH-quinone oxidoreductase subunit L
MVWEAAIWLAILLPSAVGLLSFVLGKKSGVALTATSFASLFLIATNLNLLIKGEEVHIPGPTWWPFRDGGVTFGIILDPLSLIMGLIVAFISSFVFLYSIGYMEHEEGIPRFWFFMGNFEASMLLLIFSDNLIMTLIGWEGVGLSSFFLIGHYFSDKRDKWLGGPKGVAPFAKPSYCGLKALLTTGFADTFMLVGILILYSLYGTFNFLELESKASLTPVNGTLLTLASLLLIMGPLGKSAQFPFQEWLPEAMAGPTPVSALLHSATMVKAGIYLVARLSPFYYILMSVYPGASQAFFLLAAIFGITTALLGSMYGMISIEMKKILAYSTISQLGYMLMALGIAGISGNPLLGFVAALFHLFSHSLFKAALFLSAGVAIHESHTIYVTEMGGLRRRIPVTFFAMTIAALSLAGLPPLLGFWSKDTLLAATYPVNWPVAILAALAAVFTAFYSVRLISLTFLGKGKGHKGHKGHETLIMVGPPLFLASLTLAFGLIGPMVEKFFDKVFHHSLYLYGSYSPASVTAMASSAIALTLGLGSSYLLYINKNKAISSLSKSGIIRSLYSILWIRPFDRLYSLMVSSSLKVSGHFYSFEMLLNRGMNGLATSVMKSITNVRRIHSGDLNLYLGIAALLLLFLIIFMLGVAYP